MRITAKLLEISPAGAAIDFARAYAREVTEGIAELPIEAIGRAAVVLATARDEGRSVFVFGNGGAGATAQHLATDLGKGAARDDGPRFRVRTLGDNRAWATAIANDMGYENLFVEELKNFFEPGDVCVALSASGESENVLRAARHARDEGGTVINISGMGGGALSALSHVPIILPSEHIGRVEDLQMVACHMLGFFFIEQEP